jgi:hypothetical protein
MRKGLLTSMGLTGLLAASLVQGAVAAQAAKLHGQAHAGEPEANAIPAPPRPPFMPVQRRYARLESRLNPPPGCYTASTPVARANRVPACRGRTAEQAGRACR